MCDMIALRPFALGVAADEPKLIGDALGQQAELNDGDGAGRSCFDDDGVIHDGPHFKPAGIKMLFNVK